MLTGEYKCLIADTTRFEIGYFYCSVEKAYLHTDADGISCVVVEQYICLFDADYFNAEFAYHIVPHDYDIFDSETFANNPIEFTVVCTDVTTGKAVYHQLDHVDYETLEWIRASASMPMVSRVVPIGNHQLLDGGVSDSIPLAYYESQGYKRNIVILTQPAGYRKSHNALMPLMRLALRHYPNMIEAMDQRHLMYNRQLDYVTQAEKEGRCLVIRPEGKIPIGHLCHDPKRMQLVYELGREVGHKQLDAIKEYYR